MPAFRRYQAGGVRLFSDETFLYIDIAGFRQFVYLHAQVACRGAGLFPYINEICLVYACLLYTSDAADEL